MPTVKHYFLLNGVVLFAIALLFYLFPNSNWLLNIDEVSYNFFSKALSVAYGIFAINSFAGFMHLEASKFKKYFFLTLVAFNLLFMFNYFAYFKSGLLSNNYLFYLHFLLFLIGLIIYLYYIPKINNEKS